MKVLNQVWKAYGLPAPTLEYKFHPLRKWRFDYAWPDYKVAVEIEGIFYRSRDGKSRHQTGSGYAADMEKYNAATELGWFVLRYLPNRINYVQIATIIKQKGLSIFADEEIQTELELRKKIYKNACGGYRNNTEIVGDMIHEIKELKQISSEKTAKITYLVEVDFAEKLKKTKEWIEEKTEKMGQRLVVDYDLIFGYKKEK